MWLDPQVRPQRFPFLGTDPAYDQQIFNAVKWAVLGAIVDDSTRQFRADARQFGKIIRGRVVDVQGGSGAFRWLMTFLLLGDCWRWKHHQPKQQEGCK